MLTRRAYKFGLGVAALMLLLGGGFPFFWLASGAQTPATADYSGSSECRACHQDFYAKWANSFHGLAMRPYDAGFARSNLAAQPAAIRIQAYQYQMNIATNGGFMTEKGPDGEKKRAIAHAMGGKNVFYFLTPMDRGKLQVLPLAYDVRHKEWFDTTESGLRHFAENPDQALDWRERPLTFNSACYKCHVSQLTNNFDLKTETYHTIWKEPGINCETCHGPGGEHARRFREAAPGSRPKQLGVISTKTMSKVQINDLCSSCHAKMMLLTTSFNPGDRFFDHFDLVAWENPDYYPDGRDLGENYTATSYRSSACVKSGKLDCMHCHTSSGRYRFSETQANNACLPCHSEKVSRVAEHSRHKPGGEGGRCVSCHMPATEFARMRRTDHSMHPPAPAATAAFKSPNACNLCHDKETPAWADQKVRSWHQHDYQAPVLMRGGLIASARRGDWTRLKEMLAELDKTPRDEIAAASLIRLLRPCGQETIRPALLACLQDGSPVVRASAVEALGDRLDRELVPVLSQALRDDYRLVRVRAAAALAGVPEELVADRGALSRALAEYESGLLSMPDDPMAHYNLGNYRLQCDKPDQAVASFEVSLRMQSNNVPVLVNASLAYSQLGQNNKALASLREAVRISPTNAPALFNLGLLLGELGRSEEAESALRAAVKHDPQSPQAAFNLAVLLADRSIEEAITLCRRAAELRPAEPKYTYTMAYYLQKSGSDPAAIDLLRKFIEKPCQDPGIYGLLGQLLERHNQTREAAAVYGRAARNELLPEAERIRFGARSQALLNR